MALVLEGPDCTGKTTLALELCKEGNTKYLDRLRHPNCYKKPGSEGRGAGCFDVCEGIEAHEIWDRWWISEWAYSLLHGREFGVEYPMQLLELSMIAYRKRVVVVIPCIPTIIHRMYYQQRGDDQISMEQLDTLRYIYYDKLLGVDQGPPKSLTLKCKIDESFRRIQRFLPPITHSWQEALAMERNYYDLKEQS